MTDCGACFGQSFGTTFGADLVTAFWTTFWTGFGTALVTGFGECKVKIGKVQTRLVSKLAYTTGVDSFNKIGRHWENICQLFQCNLFQKLHNIVFRANNGV